VTERKGRKGKKGGLVLVQVKEEADEVEAELDESLALVAGNGPEDVCGVVEILLGEHPAGQKERVE